MPIFTPGRRWQPAYSPFKHETFGSRVLERCGVRRSRVRCLAAACAATACCRRPPSSARWNAPRACATARAAARPPSTATWIRPVPASGTRSTNGPSRWAARKSCWKCCRRWIGTRSAPKPGADVVGQVRKWAREGHWAACSRVTRPGGTKPGRASSDRCASRSGGRATRVPRPEIERARLRAGARV